MVVYVSIAVLQAGCFCHSCNLYNVVKQTMDYIAHQFEIKSVSKNNLVHIVFSHHQGIKTKYMKLLSISIVKYWLNGYEHFCTSVC